MPDLRFTRDSILNTVLRDEQGKPVYRIETHGTLFGKRVTSIGLLGSPRTQRMMAFHTEF